MTPRAFRAAVSSCASATWIAACGSSVTCWAGRLPGVRPSRYPGMDVPRTGPSAEDAYGRTVTAAHSPNGPLGDGDAAVCTPADARIGESGPTRAKGRGWARDWTAWALIALLPATIFGIVGLNYAMGKVGYGIGGTVLTLPFGRNAEKA